MAMVTMVMMIMVKRGHRGPSNYICSKCRSCCSSPSSGCHCNLLIIWPANICIWRHIILALLYLYFSLYVFYTSVFVFEQISFLYFCPCLHLSKYTVLDAPYFRKGHLATVSLVGGKQTPQSPNQSMWHKRKHNIWMLCALLVYILRYYYVSCYLKRRCSKSLFMHWNRSPDTCSLYFVIVFMDTHKNKSFAQSWVPRQWTYVFLFLFSFYLFICFFETSLLR